MSKNAEFQMTIGSKYRVRSLESREKPLISQGIFKGYTAFGHTDALVMELDESHGEGQGRVRIIPAHMVVAIDVLLTAEGTDAKEKEKETSRYFG
jgi:hypothetical protein